MGVRVRDSLAAAPRSRQAGAGFAAGLVVFVLSLLLLLANGRPVGEEAAGGAAAWLLRGALALAAAVFEVDATGRALVGKLLAAAFAALASAALFSTVARRHGSGEARWAAFALAWGTTLAAAAQAFSGESAAACAVAWALALLARAEAEDATAPLSLAGLPLGLAVACQPSTLALALVLAAAFSVRRPRALPGLLVCALPGAALALAARLSSTPGVGAAKAAADPGALALLASPAKGLLVFAPVVLVGLVGIARALVRRESRFWDQPRASKVLPLACGLAALAHVASVAWLGGWAQGAFWGPRLLAPAWPLLLLFLPEGFAVLKLAGTLLVLVSVAVQGLGAVSYDGRWDRLHRGPDGRLNKEALWEPGRSPLALALSERVIRPSLPGIDGRRLVIRQHAFGGNASTASLAAFQGGRLRLTGADATMEGVRLEQGARIEADRLVLTGPGDGLAFRVREGARPRRLEVRVAGSGSGTLGLGAGSFHRPASWHTREVAGRFRLRLPYSFAQAGGADLVVALRGGGPLTLESVALVPPGEPENVIRLP